MITLAEVLRRSTGYLEQHGSPTPRLDAELLLAHGLGLSRIELYTQYQRPLDDDELAACRELVRRRGLREPVAYVIGSWGFRGLDLAVDARVLVPRPETELLVDRCLELLERVERPRVVDVGTGSGAIALSLKSERPDAEVVACDISQDALDVAAANAARLGLDVELHRSDLLAQVPGDGFQLVVSNPPYVSEREMADLEPEVAEYEPRLATVAGPDGLEVYRRLLPEAAGAAGGRRQPGARVRQRPGPRAGRRARRRRVRTGGDRSRPGRHRAGGVGAVAVTVPPDAARLLAGGGLALLPTDTVYGIACAAADVDACARLYALKQRPATQATAAVLGSLPALLELLPEMGAGAAAACRVLLPGPYTLDRAQPGRTPGPPLRRRARAHRPARAAARPGRRRPRRRGRRPAHDQRQPARRARSVPARPGAGAAPRGGRVRGGRRSAWRRTVLRDRCHRAGTARPSRGPRPGTRTGAAAMSDEDTTPSPIDRLLDRSAGCCGGWIPHQAEAAVRAGGVIVDTRSHEQRVAGGVVPGSIRVHRNVLEWRVDPSSAGTTSGSPSTPAR